MTRASRRYAAFISYAHRWRTWVEIFVSDLEAGLRQHADQRPIFFDNRGLRPGEPWLGQLERALTEAERFLLIVTPETMASPWSQAEQDAYRATEKHWRARFLPIVLIPTPLPPFLRPVQSLSLADCDSLTHRNRIASILAWLLDSRSSEFPPDLPEPLRTPLAPKYDLPIAQRDALIKSIAPLVKKRSDRSLLAAALGLTPDEIDNSPTLEFGASTALVLATGDDPPTAGAIRAIDQITRAFGDDEPAIIRSLQLCRKKIQDHRKSTACRSAAVAGSRTLLEVYRESVVDEQNHLLDYFHREQELGLLDRVFVDLKVRWRDQLAEMGPGKLLAAKGRLPIAIEAPKLSDLLALDTVVHPWVTRRWVVLGDPGSGKTTLFRHLAWKIAGSDASKVPVFASIPRLVRDGRSPLAIAEEVASGGVETS